MTNWPEFAAHMLRVEAAQDYFRQGVENLNGNPLTVGMLRDWLDACTTDDDEVSFGDGIIGVKITVPSTTGGPELWSYTYLDYDGGCYSSPVPHPPELGPQEWFSMERVLERMRERSNLDASS